MKGLIDFHCDTLTELHEREETLWDNTCHISLKDIPGNWGQVFAVFMPDEKRGQEAIDYFDAVYDLWLRELKANREHILPVKTGQEILSAWEQNKTAGMLMVEGGSALAGDIRRVKYLYERGVRILTLTWNGTNELGSGQQDNLPLTAFGEEVIREMERLGMVVDVSHLSDKGFWQVARLSRRPFVATHSNSRCIAKHPRNLTDEQFLAIQSSGGIVGLNLCPAFLADDPSDAVADRILQHIRHFLEMGGEDVLCFGSDFDGTDVPKYINSPQKLAGFTEYMIQSGLDQRTVEKISYQNAIRFFERYGI